MQALPEFVEHVSFAAGTPMHHIQAGDGDLLVLIHGSLCDYRYWRWQMEAFAASFRVVAPSLPGCWPEAIDQSAALSAATSDRAEANDIPFSMAQHVASIVDFCTRVGVDRPVHLVGHSRGAQVALEAALAMPQRMGKLVLADPGFAFTDEPIMPAVHTQIAQRLGHAPTDEVLADFVDAVNGTGTWRQTVTWFKDMVRANAWTLLPQLADMARHIERNALREVECPVLLVGGQYSPQRYGTRIDALLHALPRAERLTVPKAAHGMNLANARYFNDAVLSFLQRKQ